MSVNGKEVSTGGCWDYLSSALKESEKYGNTKKDI
jgi:hypothetical protein